MPPARFTPGSKSPSTPSDYSDAQYKALEGVKVTTPKLKKGAARTEFVNHVMLADGTISSDVDALRQGAALAESYDRAALKDFLAAHKEEILDDTIELADREQLVRLRSAAAHRLVDELEDAIAQARFLFIADAAMCVRIYFQCFTGVDADGKSTNPDVELADPETSEPSEGA